jgi:hypothetical protein
MNFQLPEDQLRRLEDLARQTGRTAEEVVREFVDEGLAQRAPNGQGGTTMPPEQWSAEWHAWAASHPTLPHIADDSRESIYADRGE